MSARSAKNPPPSAEAVRKAQEAAEKKVQAIKAEVERDQAWLDARSSNLSDDQKDELFRQASSKCRQTSKQDGKIVVACPIPKKLQYCVDADTFSCPHGRANSGRGCIPSERVTQALRDESTCIDAKFISEAEGGSYPSPYVPWGPISGKSADGSPALTHGNSSGVTIGTGVDLGVVEPDAYLRDLEKAGVSQRTRDTLKPLLGKKREDACKALRQAKGSGSIVLPPEDIELIDISSMQAAKKGLKSQFERARKRHQDKLNSVLKKELGNKVAPPVSSRVAELSRQIDETKKFGELTCAQQTILFSTYYHEGSIFGGGHKQALLDALLDGDDDAVRQALEQKTEHDNPLIAARGKNELSYFDDGGTKD